jgi:hypothetical protein
MKGLGTSQLDRDQRERWAEARRRLYRKVLQDPSASDESKKIARRKIDLTRVSG